MGARAALPSPAKDGTLGHAMRTAGWTVVCGAVGHLLGCANASSRPSTPPAAVLAADAAPASCGPDIATRRPNAEPVDGVDLDGDGDIDLVFRDGHDMFGNADFLYYRVDGACAVYVGAVKSFVVNTPHCAIDHAAAKAPTDAGAPGVHAGCRLAATERMFHDDYQETFYALVGGTLVEVGHGKYIPTPERHKHR